MTTDATCRVLVVDDEVEFVQTLAKRLTLRKLDVHTANDGERALELLASGETDVVLLDVKMAGMSGIDTLREIKKKHPLTEVIMVTGHANVEVAVEGMELGAFDYLIKPVELNELLYKIQDAHKKKSIQEDKIRALKG